MTLTESAGGRVTAEIAEQIAVLNYRYAQALDDRRLDDWPEFFLDDGRYIIHPRENRDRGLEGYWIYCDSKRMMLDRVLSIKEVNLYNIHYNRRAISNILVTDAGDGVYIARSNYSIVQTNSGGRSAIFSVGAYVDQVVFIDEEPKFQEKIVIPDTFTVSPLVAIPL
jgi:anthranilate 1,2-dioxygenase small subunit